VSWEHIDPDTRYLAERVLTPKQLEVIHSRADNQTWNTIALNMNLDEATVRGHYKRGLRRIAAARKEPTA
jgi:DNA-binding CsgD family transcriptional regulator